MNSGAREPRRSGVRSRPRWLRALPRVSGVVSLGLVVACGSAGGSPGAEDAAQQRVALERQLVGPWKLVSFVPAEPLDPVLTTVLAAQDSPLVVVFEDGRVRSASPSLSFERAYRIEQPGRVPFRVVLTDEQGVTYETRCSFDHANRLHFESSSPPWRGHGILAREGAGLDALR